MSTPCVLVPICGHASLQSVLAHGPQGAITVQQWLQDARRLQHALPEDCTHVLNICEDRYHFLVALGACLLGNKVSLQPSSLAPAALAQLTEHAPNAVCLHDHSAPFMTGVAVPTLHVADVLAVKDETPAIAHIPGVPADQVVAQVFTSGSTGKPVAHNKTWGKLRQNIQGEAQCLGLADAAQPWCLVGTVPSQHMYGFESVLLLALLGGHSLWTGRPLYPADVADALAAVPQPRMLVTTPVHLKALVDSKVAYPPVDQLLCATAPLPQALAQQAQQLFDAPLFEIYGCTETGQIAFRQTLQSPAWTLFPNVVLEQSNGETVASGGHVERAVALADVIDMVDARRFVLQGRTADMVNIAGKRSSLAYLNSQLVHIDGLRDGAFFLPEPHTAQTGSAEVQRLCLVACAPGVPAAQIMTRLRQYVDAVFLPRPLIVVDQLPRNATGKLPQAALQALYDQHMNKHRQTQGAKSADQPDSGQSDNAHLRWQVPAQHPAFAGHFPNHPVLPGALLLQHCVDMLASVRAGASLSSTLTVQSAKFLQTCQPGDVLDFFMEANTPASTWTFNVQRGDTVVMRATIAIKPAGDKPC